MVTSRKKNNANNDTCKNTKKPPEKTANQGVAFFTE